MINYGGGLIFPDSWAGGPPDHAEWPEPDCHVCGDTGTMDLDCAPGGLTPVPCPYCHEGIRGEDELRCGECDGPSDAVVDVDGKPYPLCERCLDKPWE